MYLQAQDVHARVRRRAGSARGRIELGQIGRSYEDGVGRLCETVSSETESMWCGQKAEWAVR